MCTRSSAGRSKGGAFADAAAGRRRSLPRRYLIGEAAGSIADGAAPATGVELVRSGDLEHAVAEASQRARPGEVVLLAPACASFDQYRDYEERGEHFRALVRRLAAGAMKLPPRPKFPWNRGKSVEMTFEEQMLRTATLALIAFGAVMVYSASSGTSLLSDGGDSSEYLKRYVALRGARAGRALVLRAQRARVRAPPHAPCCWRSRSAGCCS